VWTFGHLRVLQRPLCSTRGGAQEDIYVKPVGGGSSEQLLLGGEGNKEPDRWSADGRYIIYDNIGNKATGTDCLGVPDIRRPQPFPVVQTPATDFYGNLSPAENGRPTSRMNPDEAKFT